MKKVISLKVGQFFCAHSLNIVGSLLLFLFCFTRLGGVALFLLIDHLVARPQNNKLINYRYIIIFTGQLAISYHNSPNIVVIIIIIISYSSTTSPLLYVINTDDDDVCYYFPEEMFHVFFFVFSSFALF